MCPIETGRRSCSHAISRTVVQQLMMRSAGMPCERTRPQILRGEAPDAVRIPAGCRFHPRCPIAIDDCRRIDPALEPAGGSDHMAACILAG